MNILTAIAIAYYKAYHNYRQVSSNVHLVHPLPYRQKKCGMIFAITLENHYFRWQIEQGRGLVIGV